MKFAQEIQDIVFDVCCNNSTGSAASSLMNAGGEKATSSVHQASAYAAVDVAGEAAAYFENEEYGEKEIEKNFFAISSLVSYIDAVEPQLKANYTGCQCWTSPYDGHTPDPVLFREPEPEPEVVAVPNANTPEVALTGNGTVDVSAGNQAQTPANTVNTGEVSSVKRRPFDRRSSMRRSARPNSYFGVRHSSAMYGATNRVIDLSLGNTFDFDFDELYDDFEFDDEPAVNEQKATNQRTGAEDAPANQSAASTPRDAGNSSSFNTTPAGTLPNTPLRQARSGGASSMPVDYFKLAFDEDAMSLAYKSDSQDESSDFAQSPYGGVSGSWVFVGWSEIQDLDTFIQVLGRVPASHFAAKCSTEDNLAFIEEKFKETFAGSSDSPVAALYNNSSSDTGVESGSSSLLATTSASIEPTSKHQRDSTVKESVLCKAPTVCRYVGSFRSPNVGPFLTTLLHKLENMTENSLFVNLQLTGLVSRLACYPQPLIFLFLLNSSLKLHCTIRPLFQILSSIRNRIDSHICSLQNFEMFWLRAQRYLILRGQTAVHGGYHARRQVRGRRASVISHELEEAVGQPSSAETKKQSSVISPAGRKPSGGMAHLFQQLQRQPKKGRTRSVDAKSLHSTTAGSRQRTMTQWTNEQPDDCEDPVSKENSEDLQKTKTLVYSAIVLEEFLKELAAIALNHTVLMKNCPTVPRPV